MMMSEIYRKAAAVITYTGPEDIHTRPAILLAFRSIIFMEQVWPTIADSAPDNEEPLSELFTSMACSDHPEEFGFPPLSDRRYRSLRRLLRMSWSSRAWIIQESVANQRNLMLCGTVMLEEWALLGRVVSGVLNGLIPRQCAIDVGEDLERKTPVTGPEYVHMVTSFRQTAWSDGRHGDPDRTLFQLLHRFHSFQSSDPSDKIFAIIGMARDREVLGIKPEYDKTPREVYIETAIRILQNDLTLYLFFCIRGDKKIDLPSWVPDWSVFDHELCGANNYLRFADLLSAGLYQAGSAQHSQLKFSSDSTELAAKGILFDQLWQAHFAELIEPIWDIDIAGGRESHNPIIVSSGQAIRSKFELIRSRASKHEFTCPYKNSGGFKSAFARTLAGNVSRFWTPIEASADIEEKFDAYLSFHDGSIAERQNERSSCLDPKTKGLAFAYFRSIAET
ncbi:hypothetical protein GQ44DRAFT_338203 [Phaeosphaeriaceae sp. PMI808]|nr:hypothetical protein GQ44DRAFT_338203 [Phaeosphaeriaceae sp. PMI808]